jgi:hypothetical protein
MTKKITKPSLIKSIHKFDAKIVKINELRAFATKKVQ